MKKLCAFICQSTAPVHNFVSIVSKVLILCQGILQTISFLLPGIKRFVTFLNTPCNSSLILIARFCQQLLQSIVYYNFNSFCSTRRPKEKISSFMKLHTLCASGSLLSLLSVFFSLSSFQFHKFSLTCVIFQAFDLSNFFTLDFIQMVIYFWKSGVQIRTAAG